MQFAKFEQFATPGMINMLSSSFAVYFPNWNDLFASFLHFPLLATATEVESSSLVIVAVLLSLVIIYIAAKLGGELCIRMQLPSVLGELIGGVVVGISVLHLLVFPTGESTNEGSVMIAVLGAIAHLNPDSLTSVFQIQAEVIANLAELGAIIISNRLQYMGSIRN